MITSLIAPGAARSADDGTWSEMFSQVQYGHIGVHDAKRDRMLIIGPTVMALPLSGVQTWTEVNAIGVTPATQTAIYDPVRDRVVAYGGASEVWALSLAGTPSWTQVTPAGTPPPSSYGPAAIYDPVLDRMLVFSLPDGVWQLALSGNPEWTKLATEGTSSPGPYGFSAVYDPVRNRAIVYGGDESFYGQTYALSLSGTPTWTELPSNGAGLNGHTAIYDASHDRMVVFGGRIFGVYASFDMWALSLSGSPEWTKLAPSGRLPQTRAWHAAIYDPVRAQMVIYGGDNQTSRTDDEWTDTWKLALTGNLAWTAVDALPSPRNRHTAVYDSRHDRMLVFAGGAERHISDPRDDLPVLSLSGKPSWGVLNAGASPEVTENHTAIYDPARDRMLIFDGAPTGVWQLSLSGTPAWAPVTPTGTSPSGSGPTVYDSQRNRVLLFSGGVFALSLSGAPVWSELSTSGTPGGGYSPIYDPVRDRVVFSGATAVSVLSLSGSPTWTSVTPSGTPPTDRLGPAIYDPVRDRIVIFAGYDSYNGFGEVSALSLNANPTWSQLTPAGAAPRSRYGHTAIYDPLRDQMIVYGGVTGFYYEDLDDTWALVWGTPLDTTPPRITVSLNRDVLWPANHKLVDVCATVKVTDAIDPNPSFQLFSITSNEAGNGKGGKKTDDITGAMIGSADLCYGLRASRDGGPNGRAYQIIYQARDASNNVAYDTVYVRVPASMSTENVNAALRTTALSSIHPNPFNPETTVEYSLERAERVVISIYNVSGSLVRRLVDETTAAGEHRAIWDGIDDTGQPASSGMYFVRMSAGSHTETRKIVMLK